MIDAIIKKYIQKHPLHTIIIIIVLSISLVNFAVSYSFGQLVKNIYTNDFSTSLFYFLIWIIVLRSCYFVYDICDRYIQPAFLEFIREESVSITIKSHLSRYERADIGDVVTKISKVPFTIERIFNNWLHTFIPMILTALIILYFVSSIDYRLAFLILGIPISCITLAIIVIPYKCINVSKTRDRVFNSFMTKVDDILRNLVSIYTENTQQFELFNLNKYSKSYTTCFQNTIDCYMWVYIISFIMNMIFVVVFFYMCKGLIETKRMDIASFTTVSLLTFSIFKKSIESNTLIKDLLMSYGIIYESYKDIFDTSGITEVLLNVDATIDAGVIIHDMSYTTKDGNIIFDKLNIEFPRNIVNIIQGKNGRGKTTLCKLILGHLRPSHGEIIVSSDKISYIPQNLNLFNVTIYENIIYGNINPPSFDDVYDIILKHSLHTYIPNINTIIEKNGSNISGGQRQMILLLRALCNKEKMIYVFDEPTSALDHNVKIIAKNMIISFASNDKTVIVITHDHVFEADDKNIIISL